MKTDVPPCPRRKVVKAEFFDDVERWPGRWVLTYSCGHSVEKWYRARTWAVPKTTQCGQCWRETSLPNSKFPLPELGESPQHPHVP